MSKFYTINTDLKLNEFVIKDIEKLTEKIIIDAIYDIKNYDLINNIHLLQKKIPFKIFLVNNISLLIMYSNYIKIEINILQLLRHIKLNEINNE